MPRDGAKGDAMSTLGLHGIDLTAPGGVDRLLAFHRDLVGSARMESDGAGSEGDEQQCPQRPDGVSDAEWDALGDPGKQAIVRERARATAAERDLAIIKAAQAKAKTPPADSDEGDHGEGNGESGGDGGKQDIAAVVRSAVEAAMAPVRQAQEQRETEEAARRVVDALTTAAKTRLHDSSDALTQVDIAGLTDGSGRPDDAKITAALDDLLKRKPHLAKPVDDRRRAQPGAPLGSGQLGRPIDDRVKEALSQMQAATGVKLAKSG